LTPDPPPPISLYKQLDQTRLSWHSPFTFHCHAGLSCFNRCCRTPTIILSPYDILRLKQALEITSGEFLPRYTLRQSEPASGLPLVFLDAFRSAESACPFLGPQGCTVYPHRPAACRLFPITMGSQLTEDGVVDYYFCRRLDYCRGFDTEVEWTVADWMRNQGFAEYDQERRAWIEILLQAGLAAPRPLDAQIQELLATIAYDLDQCRRLLLAPAILAAYDLAGPALELLQRDDLALLRFSYRVLRSLLFEEGAGWVDAVLQRPW
jgi:Fe-S-cluster containining protein